MLKTCIFGLFLVGCSETSSGPPGSGWSWTASIEFGSMPRWSPVGGEILFGDDTPGRPGLWIWDTASDPTPLADSLPPHNWDYQWSPDASRIGFTAPGEPGEAILGVWIIDVASGEKTRVFDRGRDFSWGGDPYGVYVRLDSPDAGEQGIYRIDLATGDDSLVFGGGFHPVAARTGGAVACSDGVSQGRLMRIQSDGTQDTLLGPGVVQWKWSLDGARLYCILDKYLTGRLQGQLWRVDFTNGVRADSLTSWAAFPAPDAGGGKVAFLRTSGSTWSGLWLNELGGGDSRIADFGQNPDYDPQGDRIAANSIGGGIRILAKTG